MLHLVKVKRLNDFLKEKKMTDYEFCDWAGISYDALDRILYEDGKTDIVTLFKIAGAVTGNLEEIAFIDD